VFKFTTGQWVLLVVLSFVWAAIGYRLSENDRRSLGRTPWGLPSAVWAVFWFLSLLLGLVLYLIAHTVGVRRAQQNPTGMVPGGLAPPPSMEVRSHASRQPTAAEQFPAYPRPANSQPVDAPAVEPAAAEPAAVEPAEVLPEPGVGQAVDDAAAVAGPASPPAWQPDPSGRFHYRWWDGSEWTSQVSIDGHHLVDTNPDQRIGPY
jgi:hypothetical protein